VTKQEIEQGVEELLEAIKVYGFPPLYEVDELPKFAFPVCSKVAQIKGLAETVLDGYYCRRESEL
jgi:hypothetical protein